MAYYPILRRHPSATLLTVQLLSLVLYPLMDGSETGRVLFLYTPAAAGGYVEELLNGPGPINDDERNKRRERYRCGRAAP